jgi:hypothetical protein
LLQSWNCDLNLSDGNLTKRHISEFSRTQISQNYRLILVLSRITSKEWHSIKKVFNELPSFHFVLLNCIGAFVFEHLVQSRHRTKCFNRITITPTIIGQTVPQFTSPQSHDLLNILQEPNFHVINKSATYLGDKKCDQSIDQSTLLTSHRSNRKAAIIAFAL